MTDQRAVNLALPRSDSQVHRFIADFAAHLRRHRDSLADAWDTAIRRDPSHASSPPSAEARAGMPVLIEGIAWQVEHPREPLSVESPVIRTAMELGRLRHVQGYSAEQILGEYELLGDLLFDELCLTADDTGASCPSRTILAAAMRLFHAVVVVERTTTAHYLALANQRVGEREDRLRAFNRAVSHEIKNRIGTILTAGELLAARTPMPSERQHHFAEMVTRNAEEMSATVENLLVLARLEDAPLDSLRAPLREVVERVMEQCRPAADQASVALEVQGPLPQVEIADGAGYLSLINYVRNAIKYRDPRRPGRVRVSAEVDRGHAGQPQLVLKVSDNGLGVPPDKRDRLFTRFFRAHDATYPGTGLGLSIVRETVQALGGRAWAEFPGEGSVFCFALPIGKGLQSLAS